MATNMSNYTSPQGVEPDLTDDEPGAKGQVAGTATSLYQVVDQHTHVPGKGLPVPAAGISIDADLPFGANKATGVEAVEIDAAIARASLANKEISLVSVRSNDAHYARRGDGAASPLVGPQSFSPFGGFAAAGTWTESGVPIGGIQTVLSGSRLLVPLQVTQDRTYTDFYVSGSNSLADGNASATLYRRAVNLAPVSVAVLSAFVVSETELTASINETPAAGTSYYVELLTASAATFVVSSITLD